MKIIKNSELKKENGEIVFFNEFRSAELDDGTLDVYCYYSNTYLEHDPQGDYLCVDEDWSLCLRYVEVPKFYADKSGDFKFVDGEGNDWICLTNNDNKELYFGGSKYILVSAAGGTGGHCPYNSTRAQHYYWQAEYEDLDAWEIPEYYTHNMSVDEFVENNQALIWA